jgi:hypothetical protein
VEERPWAVSKGCQNGNRPWALGLSKGGWAVSNRRLEKASKIDSKQQHNKGKAVSTLGARPWAQKANRAVSKEAKSRGLMKAGPWA